MLLIKVPNSRKHFPDLRMRQHFTDLSNVVRFSNFNGDFFLVGEIAENNEVFGQVCDKIALLYREL